MYFILSKVLLFLILPLYWIIILLAIAIISKNRKRKKGFFIAAAAVFYLFSIPILLNLFEKVWDIRTPEISDNKKYSCVIVLGGFAGDDGTGGGYFTGSSDRFIQGLKLLKKKKTSRILITGGNGQLVPGAFREATWVKTQLTKFDVPDSLILIESNSKNTLENAKFSKELLMKAHLPPPYLLVTSAFHMRRSLMIFKKAGIQVIPYSSNYFSMDTNIELYKFIPDAITLATWELYTKEMVGYTVNYFK